MVRFLKFLAAAAGLFLSPAVYADPDCSAPDLSPGMEQVCYEIDAHSTRLIRSALVWQYVKNNVNDAKVCPAEKYLVRFEQLQNAVIDKIEAACAVNLMVSGGMAGAGYSMEVRACNGPSAIMRELDALSLSTYSCQVPRFSSLSSRNVTVDKGPSFDCAKATTDSEKRICQSSDLSLLDRYLAALYEAALKEYPESAGKIRAEQKEWLRNRRGYLLERYEQRIQKLQALFKPERNML